MSRDPFTDLDAEWYATMERMLAASKIFEKDWVPSMDVKLTPEKIFVSVVKRLAKERPNQVAYRWLNKKCDVEKQLTRAELDAAARSVAGYLQTEIGLVRGDTAMIVFPPGIDFVVGFMGCCYAGVIAVPAYPPNPMNMAKDMPRFRKIMSSSGTKTVITNTSYRRNCQMVSAVV